VTARKALSSLTKEQRNALSGALSAFVDALSASEASDVLTEKAWHNRANWVNAEWAAWETWVWYKHFCRLVSRFNVTQWRESNKL
jgi:nuclear cap-binding protein subunit 1